MNTTPATCAFNGAPVDCGPLTSIMIGFMLIWVLVIIVSIVAMWKVYAKAGKPGWTSIVPIYNMVVLLEIVKKPTWWVLLMFVPFVNVIVWFVMCTELAKAFGKGIGFTIGLILLPFVFYPILAFGKARYVYGETAL
jgi:hypothetical protein